MSSRIGVLFVGFGGAVSTTSVIAALAIAKGISPPYGLYTETNISTVKDGVLDRHNQKPIKEVLSLLQFNDLVFGGWDIEDQSLYDASLEQGVVPLELIHQLASELKLLHPLPGVFSSTYVKNLHGKYLIPAATLWEAAQVLQQNIREFQHYQQCERVLVINTSSTEAYYPLTTVHQTLTSFEEGLRQNDSSISPVQVYAYAALAANAPYVNFTPSLAEEAPALRELAAKTKTPFAGKDGKTGQTLLKTALAPLFRLKNLRVEGWFSTNILGNKDGLVLDDPGSLKSKIVTKSSVLDQILGYSPYHKVNINYYPPRGDNKEAWDNVDFLGILGMPMQLKINFLCRDSILAAGAVLDLIRLLEYSARHGESGVQEQLSFFFKSPLTTMPDRQPIHDFFKQEGMLKDWLREKAFGVKYCGFFPANSSSSSAL